MSNIKDLLGASAGKTVPFLQDVDPLLQENPKETLKERIESSAPSYKYEYCDGKAWYSLASEYYVNVLVKQACLVATTEPLQADYDSDVVLGSAGQIISQTEEPLLIGVLWKNPQKCSF